MAKIRKDDKGLYVKVGGYIARPGNVRGFDHIYMMSAGGLKEGDNVPARHLAGTQLTRLKLPNGTFRTWHHEGPERDIGLREEEKIDALTQHVENLKKKVSPAVVYVLIKSIPYDGDELIDIFAIKEDAEKAMQQAIKDDKSSSYYWNVEEYKVK